ncbi:MAG: hypothetical protein WBW33_06665, partial [Bryobacteraceae bacterium]
MKTSSIVCIAIVAVALSPAMMAASPKTTRQPKLLGIGSGSYVPQLLDGGNYRTIIYVQNFGTKAESYILNLKNEDGTPASFHIAELGGTTGSLSGTLQPLAVAVFHTNSGAAVLISQAGWAEFDIFNTGDDVSVYEIIESADPITGVWTTQSMVVSNELFVSDSEKPLLLFDQTGGVVCGAAVVNPDSYSTASLVLEVLDASGLSVGTATLTIQPLHHTSFKLGDLLPASVGITGSVRFSNAATDQIAEVAIMGIKATAYKSGWTQTS